MWLVFFKLYFKISSRLIFVTLNPQFVQMPGFGFMHRKLFIPKLFENRSSITSTHLQCVMSLEGILAGKQDKGVRSEKHMSRHPDFNRVIGKSIL